MTSDSPIMWVSSFVLFFVFAPGLAVTFAPPSSRQQVTLLLLVPSIAAVLVGGVWALLSASPSVSLYQGSIAAACAVSVLAVGMRQPRLRGMSAFILVWSVLVLVPVGHALFDLRKGLLVTTLGALDFGGAAVLAVCTGVAGCVLAVFTRRSLSAAASTQPSKPRQILLSSVALIVGFLGLALGAELTIDDASVVIVRNVLIGCAMGAVGWTAAQLLTARRVSLSGVRSGLIAGAVSGLAALPWLEPGAAIALAVIAGMLGELSAAWLERRGAGEWSQLGGTLLIPGIFGLIGAGVLAQSIGLLYSGHADQLEGQVFGLLAVVGYSFAATTVIAIGVQLIATRAGRAAALRRERA